MTLPSNLKRYYVHNGAARCSLAMQHETVSGNILLALSFATTKPDANGRVDVYSKKVARQVLDQRFDEFMRLTIEAGTIPPLVLTPNVLFIGIYDGRKSKNDIFGPLIDAWSDLMVNRGSVDAIRSDVHIYAAALLVQANHRQARLDRETLKKGRAEVKFAMNNLIAELDKKLRELKVSDTHVMPYEAFKPTDSELDEPIECIGLSDKFDKLLE